MPITNDPSPRAGEIRSSRAFLVIQRGPQAGGQIDLHPGVNQFGREEGIVLKDVLVSRRHAQIVVTGNEYRLVDLSSTNGTFLNGQRIEDSQALQDGDTIRMGETIFFFHIEGQGKYDLDSYGARPPITASWSADSLTLHIDSKKPPAPSPANTSLTDEPEEE